MLAHGCCRSAYLLFRPPHSLKISFMVPVFTSAAPITSVAKDAAPPKSLIDAVVILLCFLSSTKHGHSQFEVSSPDKYPDLREQ